MAINLTSNDRPSIKGWAHTIGYQNEHAADDDEYTEKISGDEYPVRVTKAGSGLELILAHYKRDDTHATSCSSPVSVVTLTSPGESTEVPSINHEFSHLKNVIVSIEPKVKITSDGLRDYMTNRRTCFYDGERRLRFYKFYTDINCEVECLANVTEMICGCVIFSSPRTYFLQTTTTIKLYINLILYT